MKHLKKIALLMALLVISMPFTYASLGNEGSTTNEDAEETFSTYTQEQDTQDDSGFGDNTNTSPPADKCMEKAEQSSSLAEFMDNGVMSLISMVLKLLKGICDTMSTIDQMASTVDKILGLPPCCVIEWMGLGIGLCVDYHTWYATTWQTFYSNTVGIMCCFVNCNHCGKNPLSCLAKSMTKKEQKANKKQTAREYDAAAENAEGLDSEDREKLRSEADELEGEADEMDVDSEGQAGEEGDEGEEGGDEGFLGLGEQWSKEYWENHQDKIVPMKKESDPEENEDKGFLEGTLDQGNRAAMAPYRKKGEGSNLVKGALSSMRSGGVSPHNNIYVAGFCLCIPGLVYNLEKLASIYKSHECCVKNACEKGVSTEACDRMLDEATCMYWEGGAMKAILGFLMGKIKNWIQEQIKQFIKRNVWAQLPCVLAIWDLKNVPQMIGSLGKNFKNIKNDEKCSGSEFNKIEDAKGLQKDAKERAKEFGESSNRTFRAADKNGDGVLDSMEAAQTQRAQGISPDDLEKGDYVLRPKEDGNYQYKKVTKAKEGEDPTLKNVNGGEGSLSDLTSGQKVYLERNERMVEGETVQTSGNTGIRVAGSENERQVITEFGKDDRGNPTYKVETHTREDEDEGWSTEGDPDTVSYNYGDGRVESIMVDVDKDDIGGGRSPITYIGDKDVKGFEIRKSEGNLQFSVDDRDPLTVDKIKNDGTVVFQNGVKLKDGGDGLPSSYSQVNVKDEEGNLEGIYKDLQLKLAYEEIKNAQKTNEVLETTDGFEMNYDREKDRTVGYSLDSGQDVSLERNINKKDPSLNIGGESYSLVGTNLDEEGNFQGATLVSEDVKFVINKDGKAKGIEGHTLTDKQSNRIENKFGAVKGVLKRNKKAEGGFESLHSDLMISVYEQGDATGTKVEFQDGPTVSFDGGTTELDYGEDKFTGEVDFDGESVSLEADVEVEDQEEPDKRQYEITEDGIYKLDFRGVREGKIESVTDLPRDAQDKIENVLNKKDINNIEDLNKASEKLVKMLKKAKKAEERRGRGVEATDLTDRDAYLERVYHAYLSRNADWAAGKIMNMFVMKKVGEKVDEAVREKCKADWAASEPPSDNPEHHHSNAADSHPDYSACNGEKTIIKNAQITEKTRHPDGDYTYDYTYTVTNCDKNVTFDIDLRNCVGDDCERELVLNGTSQFGDQLSQTKSYTTSGNYDEICIDTTNTNEMCVPYDGTVEESDINEEESSPTTNVNDMEDCTFNYTSSLSRSDNTYAWSFTLNPCGSQAYSVALRKDGQPDPIFLDQGTTERNVEISEVGIEETSKDYNRMCLSIPESSNTEGNGKICEHLEGTQTSSTSPSSDSSSTSQLSVDQDITRSGNEYSGSFTIQAGDSPITYWARLKNSTSGNYYSVNPDGYSLSAGQSQQHELSKDGGSFDKFCVETSDDSFGSDGIKCYDI